MPQGRARRRGKPRLPEPDPVPPTWPCDLCGERHGDHYGAWVAINREYAGKMQPIAFRFICEECRLAYVHFADERRKEDGLPPTSFGHPTRDSLRFLEATGSTIRVEPLADEHPERLKAWSSDPAAAKAAREQLEQKP